MLKFLDHNFPFQLLIGLVTLFSPAWDTQTGLFAFSSAFGFLSGSYGFLKAGVSQVLGKEKFSTSFSWFLMLEGLGIGLGPTIGGTFPSLFFCKIFGFFDFLKQSSILNLTKYFSFCKKNKKIKNNHNCKTYSFILPIRFLY